MTKHQTVSARRKAAIFLPVSVVAFGLILYVLVLVRGPFDVGPYIFAKDRLQWGSMPTHKKIARWGYINIWKEDSQANKRGERMVNQAK